jgi:proteasome lid subunit RPN8/RPN11
MSPSAKQDFIEHAKAQHPKEACGLLVAVGLKDVYVPCENVALHPQEMFTVHPRAYLEASQRGRILAVCHSHPNGSAEMSMADLKACEDSRLPWYVLSVPSLEVKRHQPDGYRTPLLGREFVHGVLDCYTLIRDYFEYELGITLLDFDREDLWWENGQNLYLDNLAKAGFRVVNDLKKHDMLVMQLRSPVPNHGGVYLGDDVFLHHPRGRLSLRQAYGGYWAKHTVRVCRHEAVK